MSSGLPGGECQPALSAACRDAHHRYAGPRCSLSGYGQVIEAELAAVDTGLRLYLDLNRIRGEGNGGQ
jgi:hypothetical protein